MNSENKREQQNKRKQTYMKIHCIKYLYVLHRHCLGSLKGFNQAEIVKKSVILFWLLNMTI